MGKRRISLFGGSERRSFADDSRGVSEVIGTLLSLAMLGVFVGSVAFVSTASLGAANDANGQKQLEYRGEQLAEAIEGVDREVRGSAASGAIGTRVDLPERAGNEEYTIEIAFEQNNLYSLSLIRDGEDGAFTAQTTFRSETSVQTGSVRGGTLRVIRKDGASEISIEPAGTN